MSVSLQPDDTAIQAIVAYSQQTLGLNEEVRAEAPPEGLVDADENIYLYGHGGTSAIDVEDNDLFGRRNVAQLTDMLAPHIPADYTGTIFLIGCTTQPLVAGLRGALQEVTGQDVSIRGTPEKLQTRQDGGIVVRRAPATDEVASMRESVDMGRRYYGRIIRLRNAVRDAGQALLNANNMAERTQAVAQVMGALEQLQVMNQEITQGLQQLGAEALPPKLAGRRDGLQSVREDLQSVEEQRQQLLELLGQWLPLHDDAANFGTDQEVQLVQQMCQSLQQARAALNERIQVLALFTNVADEVLQGVDFQLDMMGQPAPPALVDQEEEEEQQDENQGGGLGWLVGLTLALGAFLVVGAILAFRDR